MRKIMFRAWDKNNKVMHKSFEFIRSGIRGNDWIIFKSDRQPLRDKNVFDNPYFSQQLIIMQFTGVRDKNGTGIYEGDIVRKKQTQWHGENSGYKKRIVKWVEINGVTGFNISGRKWEVVGNIYEKDSSQ